MIPEKGFQDAEQKRSITSTFHGYNKPSKHPKIQALLNEIINDSTYTAKPLPTTPNEGKSSWKTIVLPPPPQEVVVFRTKSLSDSVLLPEVIIDDPRTKSDIVGCSDDEQVDELPFRTKGSITGYGGQSSVHNHQSMDKWKVPTIKVKLLPAIPLGLIKRFKKIYKVFSHEIQRNELVSILDEMYRQNVIGPIECRQINNKLAKSIGSGFDESLVDAENQSISEKMVIDESADEENGENEEEDELLRMINLTFNHIVQDDKEELIKLIDELKEILTSDTLLELVNF